MYYVIGDCHGHIQPLRALVDAIGLRPNDHLVLLGDYIDHGPASRDVLDYLITLNKRPNVHCLLGNHELLMLGAMDDTDIEREWLRQGGDSTLESIGANCARDIPKAYRDFIESCLPMLTTADTVFVHAGIDHRKPLNEQTDDDLYWRHYPQPYHLADHRRVVSAHTPRALPLIDDHFVSLDTGMGHGGRLTCLALEHGAYLQADAHGMLSPWQVLTLVA